MTLADWIKKQGRALGFARIGIARADTVEGLEFFPHWLARGYAGEMKYLHNPKRRDVRALWPAARSVICCALPYDTGHPRSTETPPDPERGWISRYAWGDDYHAVIEEKLEALREKIAAHAGDDFECKLYVDTGPVLERVYARAAGLGWQAKNTCLLDSELGSFFFLGLLVTNLELAPDSPLPDGCGSCTLCLEACPTGALLEPYVMDARLCISYLTIELRGAIPEVLRAPMGRHVFGCDICQDVCPYNQKAWVSELAAFGPRAVEHENRNSKSENRSERPGHGSRSTDPETLFHPKLARLASLTEQDFRRVFQNSAVRRAKWRGLVRNTLVAMGNAAEARFRPMLEKFAAGDDALFAEHARWALNQLDRARVPAR
jgi:epoxyqueuosine reductase